jgi:anti-anti-sigma factor
MTKRSMFDVERDGEVLILIPRADLGESDYQDIESGARGVLELASAPEVKGVVLDFHRTNYYGSTALGLFLRLWKRGGSRGGRMAFCNLSPNEREILAVTRLDTLWPAYTSREEAVKAVREPVV